jgi:inward rectifier potassium channel
MAQKDPNALVVRVLGRPRTPLSDAHHVLLRWPWWAALVVIVGGFLLLNVLFGAAYVAIGGIEGVRPGSYVDAFFFSVQTMGTIGYGSMYPTTLAANVVVVVEAVFGLLTTAVATGLVFAKFSQARGRIAFTRNLVISPLDGIPSLQLRLGNERSNLIVEATVRLIMYRTEHTLEGRLLYRMYELPLQRDRSPALTRSWTVTHRIVPGSPLYGLTPADMKATEVEVLASVFGTDDTSLQNVHGQRRYVDSEILWGARHVDILKDEGDHMTLDLRKFHDTEPTQPAADFPYPVTAEPPRPG